MRVEGATVHKGAAVHKLNYMLPPVLRWRRSRHDAPQYKPFYTVPTSFASVTISMLHVITQICWIIRGLVKWVILLLIFNY